MHASVFSTSDGPYQGPYQRSDRSTSRQGTVATVLPIHKAQLSSYMKLLNVPVGLLLNFNEIKLVDGVHRLILAGATR
jgi:hypothetical protein